jgi:molecular chaperone GrpE (heat shock protein)
MGQDTCDSCPLLLIKPAGEPAQQEEGKSVEKPAERNQESKTPSQVSGSDSSTPDPSRLDELHQRIQSRLGELRTDFQQLETDLCTAKQESSLARKDRLEGFKRALRDLMDAADRADMEWH